MNEIIDLTGITFPWWIPLTILGVLVAAGVGLRFWEDTLGTVAIIVTSIFGVMFGLVVIPMEVVTGEVERQTISQLYDMGYREVTLDPESNKSFTTSKDGTYVNGVLVPALEPHTYHVEEVPAK